MNDDIRKQEATAIVGKILKLLESENLTVKDSERILAATREVLKTISIPVSVPVEIQWMRLLPLPTMEHHLLAAEESKEEKAEILRRLVEKYGVEEGLRRFYAGEEPP